MFRTYTTSAAGNATAAPMLTTDGRAAPVNGYLAHIEIIASADTSVAVTIADGTGNILVLGSTDFTTASGSANQNYKHDSASIVRNSISGTMKVTTTGNGSGTVIVRLWFKPWPADLT